jgi:hypothetical protein
MCLLTMVRFEENILFTMVSSFRSLEKATGYQKFFRLEL